MDLINSEVAQPGRESVLYHRSAISKGLVVLAFCIALTYVVSAVVGGIFSYSPVPFWDMWESYLGFFLILRDADWSIWWAQHNEHRIPLAKILFWIDFKLFDGRVIFLIVCNYLLATAAALTFLSILRTELRPATRVQPYLILGASIVALTFSWIQSENFSWGFQSQFFLAQLLPLLAFYAQYRSAIAARRKNSWFSLAVALGILCVGTMANGIFALPCMVLLAFLLGEKRSKILILVLAALGLIILYLHGYLMGGASGSAWAVINNRPRELILYALAYLGGPFYYLPHGSVTLAVLAGVLMAVASIFFLIRILMRPPFEALPLALLTFLAYIAATALMTASGRLGFGIHYAVSSRYMTPALMAWCVLLILAMLHWRHNVPALYAIAIAALALALTLLPHQRSALNPYNPYSFERLIAALALEMGIHDSQQILKSSPHVDATLAWTDVARQRHLSIFADPRLTGVRERIGQPVSSGAAEAPLCEGAIDAFTTVVDDPRFRAVRGWIYRPDIKQVPRSVGLLDRHGILVGYALTGERRRKVTRALNTRELYVGFSGYVSADADTADLVLLGDTPACGLPLPSSADGSSSPAHSAY